MSKVFLRYTGKLGGALTQEVRLDAKECYMAWMGVTSIDLTPLSQCTNLQKVNFGSNPLKEIDISPLFFCPSLKEVELGMGVTAYADSRLKPMQAKIQGLSELPYRMGHSIKWRDGILSQELVARLESYTKPVPVPPQTTQAPPTHTIPANQVAILRGGEIVGGKFEYKIKIQNNSKFVVTNVTVTVVAYPQDCMNLASDSTKTIARIEPAGFRSPQFIFSPTKDCVEGQVLATVSYIDHENNLQLKSVPPYPIRSVCDLLIPLDQSPEIFEKLIIDMQRTSEEQTIDWNPQVLFSKAQKLLPIKNFHVVDSDSKVIGSQFTGTIRGFAEGKYTGKKIAIQALISGSTQGNQATVVIEGIGEDVAMLPTTIEEISNGIGSWICMKCGASIDLDGVTKIKQNIPISCQYCQQTLTIDLYKK